jgi:RimJ/RimL family protein N-acetyltransferase
MRQVIYGLKTRLRRIERQDIPTFVRWFGDPQVREYLLMNRPISVAEEERWFEAQLDRHDTELFAIEAAGDGAVVTPSAGATAPGHWVHIGNTGLHEVNWTHRAAELGIVIGVREDWGRGFGSDAIRALLRFGFHEMNLHRIYLHVYEDNARAIRAYEKCGFQHEGRLRDGVYRHGRYYDLLAMSILSDEFEPCEKP